MVVLGASNIAREVDTVINTARCLVGGPIEFFGAFGHGRSYGKPSRVLVRSFGGMRDSGLWRALEARPSATQQFALLTDIGNDIGYGIDTPTIVDWVTDCARRLLDLEFTTIITGLPESRLERVPQWQFRLLKAFFFPGRPLTLASALEQARWINQRLREFVDQAGNSTHFVPLRAEWFNRIDPIHIARCNSDHAYATIMEHWLCSDGDAEVMPAPTPRTGQLVRRDWAQWVRLSLLPPEHRRWFRRFDRYHNQPVHRLRDGSTIWLY